MLPQGCDGFTKNFLGKIGVKVSGGQDPPSDPYTEHREKVSYTVLNTDMYIYAQMLGAMQPQRPYERLDTLRQFLEFDRHVLRFYCLWDDTDR